MPHNAKMQIAYKQNATHLWATTKDIIKWESKSFLFFYDLCSFQSLLLTHTLSFTPTNSLRFLFPASAMPLFYSQFFIQIRYAFTRHIRITCQINWHKKNSKLMWKNCVWRTKKKKMSYGKYMSFDSTYIQKWDDVGFLVFGHKYRCTWFRQRNNLFINE